MLVAQQTLLFFGLCDVSVRAVADNYGTSCDGDVSEQDIENHAAITNEINWQLNLFKQIKGNQNLSKFTEDKVVEQENNELCMNCLSLEYC